MWSQRNASHREDSSQVLTLSRISLAAFVGFTGLIGLLHLLDPQENLAVHLLSEYALGSVGILFSVALLVLAFGSLTIAIALRKLIGKMPRGWWIAFLLWSIGAGVAGVVPTDPGGIPVSTNGLVHGIAASTGFLAFAIGVFLLAAAFRRNERLQPYHRVLRGIAVAVLVTLIGFFASPADIKGIAERVFVGVVVMCLATIALLLLRGTQHNAKG